MKMAFDIKTVLSDMIDAFRGVAIGEWPKIKDCARKAFADEKEFLIELAEARLAGEIDDDMLAAQLRDEKETLEAVLLVCQIMGKKLLQDALNAAIDVFNSAVKTAVGGLIGARRAGAARPAKLSERRLNARPDTADFRDLMYVPTLVEVGERRALDDYRKLSVPILDQGREGACTGFGLATVAHYLLRARRVDPDKDEISPRMFYAMARRYDEWPGEAYEGSSCRGAMKGWHKHGVCASALWEHDPAKPDFSLNAKRSADAQHRPLGAYFRVNHKELVAMHSAISEVGVLYASANVHSGWNDIKSDGSIPFGAGVTPLGGHAFAIVAYDEKGLWIQNSWGKSWGKQGYGRISYADWLKNGSDVWVARLGVPIEEGVQAALPGASSGASVRTKAFSLEDVRPHIVSLGNNGELRTGGNIGNTPEQVRRILRDDFKRITQGWTKRRLVLYAHGGLVGEGSAIQRVCDYRSAMLATECYPLAFIWHSDYWSTIASMLEDATRLRRPEGVLDDVKDFMLDRLDDALEPIARRLTGKAAWDEMKENAMLATESESGGARLVLDEVAALVARDPSVEIHVVGHSAGSIFHAPLVRRLTASGPDGLGLKVASCTLWAPACTMALFEQSYLPAIQSNAIARFALYTLTDKFEQDDNCARIYNKSLLYLVSNAFEKHPHIPILRPDGESLLGMAKFIERGDYPVRRLVNQGRIDWVQAPNAKPDGDLSASGARSHGSFDDDHATVTSTLGRIVGVQAAKGVARRLTFKPGASRLRSFRRALDVVTQ
jgi:hypothetical protein